MTSIPTLVPSGYRERLDELFAGTSSLVVVRQLLSDAFEQCLAAMLLDIECEVLHGWMMRNMYIELSRQDEGYGGGNIVNHLFI